MSYNGSGLLDDLPSAVREGGSEDQQLLHHQQPPPLQDFGYPPNVATGDAYGTMPDIPVGDPSNVWMERVATATELEMAPAGQERPAPEKSNPQEKGLELEKGGGDAVEKKPENEPKGGQEVAFAAAQETPAGADGGMQSKSGDQENVQGDKDQMDEDFDDELSEGGTRRRRTFDENTEALKIFKAQFGHCNVKKGYKGDPILARWVSMVRWRRAKLTQEQREKLDALGFDWESRQQKMDRQWEAMFDRLKIYKEETGNTRVPKRYRDDQTLAKWVDYQRQQHSIGKMTPERIKRLETLDFTFRFKEGEKKASAADEAKWLLMFNRLVEYKNKHGHCLVPKSGPEAVDETFWRWVQRQRHNYAHFGRLPGDRKERLEAIGYSFGDVKSQSISVRTQSQWDQMFDKVKAFKESHGTLRITGRENARLRQWLTCQMAEGRKGNVNPKRVKRLHELGAIFCVDDDNGWEEYFQKLKAGKINNVNYEEDITGVDENTGSLADLLMADWVRRQRWLRARGYLHPDRRKKLNHTGFSWKSDNPSTISEVYAKRSRDHWGDMYKKLEAFHVEHGHVNVPKDEKSLSNWLNKQLRNGRLGILEPEYADRLKSLGLTWCEDDDEGFQSNLERLKRKMEKDPQFGVEETKTESEDKAFMEWIRRQRTLYKLKKIDPGRVAQLDEINFAWKVTAKGAKKSPKRERKDYDDDSSDTDEEFDHIKKQAQRTPAKKKPKTLPKKTQPRSVSKRKQPSRSSDADVSDSEQNAEAGSPSREKQDNKDGNKSGKQESESPSAADESMDNEGDTAPASSRKNETSAEKDQEQATKQDETKDPGKEGGRMPIGTRVRRKFPHGWHEGKVVEHRGTQSHVKYDEGDSEDLSDEELEVAAFAYNKRHKQKQI